MSPTDIDAPSPIFTNAFRNVDIDLINKDLKEKGYFTFPGAITDEALEQIEKDSTKSKLNINNNKISGIYAEKQYYLTNLLAISKTAYEFATSKIVMSVCHKYLGQKFRLKALRYYETYGGHQMRWHTDNKNDREQVDTAGIIFIFYITDVSEGQLQYVEGSHNWSGNKAYSEYSDEFILDNYKDKIVDFKFPRGSLIIYNTYGIHRACPVVNKKFVRKSVFFQIDSDLENAEPIILNTKFITNVNDQVAMFLGFGKPANYEAFPQTSLMALPINKLNIFDILKYIPYRFMRFLFDICPNYLKQKLRKILRKNHPSIFKG